MQVLNGRNRVYAGQTSEASYWQALGGLWRWRYDISGATLSIAPRHLLFAENTHQDWLSVTLSRNDYTAFSQAFLHNRHGGGVRHVRACQVVDLSGYGDSLLLFGTTDPCGEMLEGVAWSPSVSPVEGIDSALLAALAACRDALALFTPDGVLCWMNAACAELMGLSGREARLSRGRYNLLQDSFASRHLDVPAALQEVVTQRRPRQFTLGYSGRSGRRASPDLPPLALDVQALPVIDDHRQTAAVMLRLHPSGRRAGPEMDIDLTTRAGVAIRSEQGEYLYLSARLGELCSRSVATLVGCDDVELLGPVGAAGLQTIIRRMQQSAQVAVGQISGPGGGYGLTVIPLYDHGERPIASALVFSALPPESDGDVPNLRPGSLLDAVRSAICYLDRWAVVREINIAARQLMGHGDDMVGQHFVEVAANWENPEERQREIMQVIRTGIAEIGVLECVKRRGQNHWYRVDKVPTRDAAGQVSGVLLTMSEVTDEVLQARNFRDIEARYKAYHANSSDAVWCYEFEPAIDVTQSVDMQAEHIATRARMVDCNTVLLHMLGLKHESQLLGTTLADIGSKNYFFDIHSFIDNCYQLADYEIVQQVGNNDPVYRQISCVGVVEANQLVRVWGTTKDITARKRYEAQLQYQANHDALTRLPNRTRLYREVETCLQQRGVEQQSALLLIDLDRFKEINDTLGHQVGDQLLRLVGPRLQSELADLKGMVARLGGDEFAIFLPRIRNAQQAVVLAHRVLDVLSEEFLVDNFSTELSASIGISLCPSQAEDVSTLMRYADVAMYRAKKEMSGLALYSADFDPHSPKRLVMMSDLGRAIREDQLTLNLQPKINLQGRCLCGFEALLRWHHPQMGFVSPAEFIPIAELTSLIHPLTAWVLKASIKLARKWYDTGYRHGIAVNLSARNLLDDNLPALIERLLHEQQLTPAALELEITESSIMTDPVRAMRNLEKLHRLGVGLSIDDFGTGYSSLAYLKRLPVQTLKIDNSFVRHMEDDEQDEIIVNSTVHLAHNLGLKVVAEGIENQQLLEKLAALGCDEAQGYFIARPMTEEQAEQWLRTSPWARQCAMTDIN